MDSYNTLSVFPDVPPLFGKLSSSPHIHPVVFSNGAADMLSTSLTHSPDLSPHAHLFRDIVSVDDVKRFKPHPETYHDLARKVGKEKSLSDIWLVSGNPFDVVGANAVGMRTCWVDRVGSGWMDGAVEGERGVPTVVVRGVDEVVGKIEGFLAGWA